MELRYNSGHGDWKHMSLINKVSLYRGSFSIIFLLLGEEYRSLYRGIRYAVVPLTRGSTVNSLFCVHRVPTQTV